MIRLPQVDSIERAHGQVRLHFLVEPSLEYFSGHFPGCPLLPGVIQVGWAMEFGRAEFPITASFRGLAGVKFMRVIEPGDRVALALSYRSDRLELAFAYQTHGQDCSTGRLNFG